MFKECKKCRQSLPLSEFVVDKKSKDGKKRYCKTCSSLYFKLWRQTNLEEIKLRDRKKHYIQTYALSTELAEQLVANRNGICAICKTVNPLVVDHDHISGKVRDLICSSCNSLLGYAKEKVSILNSAIEYLKKHV